MVKLTCHGSPKYWLVALKQGFNIVQSALSLKSDWSISNHHNIVRSFHVCLIGTAHVHLSTEMIKKKDVSLLGNFHDQLWKNKYLIQKVTVKEFKTSFNVFWLLSDLLLSTAQFFQLSRIVMVNVTNKEKTERQTHLLAMSRSQLPNFS